MRYKNVNLVDRKQKWMGSSAASVKTKTKNDNPYCKMNILSIFLGSSFRLSYERVLIGDGIRQLSDEWEQKGVRIHLLIWEDYRAEFTLHSRINT